VGWENGKGIVMLSVVVVEPLCGFYKRKIKKLVMVYRSSRGRRENHSNEGN
jgi:hypothetical protein